jgi:hypothetical protein
LSANAIKSYEGGINGSLEAVVPGKVVRAVHPRRSRRETRASTIRSGDCSFGPELWAQQTFRRPESGHLSRPSRRCCAQRRRKSVVPPRSRRPRVSPTFPAPCTAVAVAASVVDAADAGAAAAADADAVAVAADAAAAAAADADLAGRLRRCAPECSDPGPEIRRH